MKYALLDYTYDKQYEYVNIGDYIQSLAAAQYLPCIDSYVQRDYLNQYNDVAAKIIMNGWFTYHPENWPPSNKLIPLFISFHLNPQYAYKLLDNKDNIEYLKSHAPIGCRDFSTLEILKKYKIKAYYSSCLTTTLDLTYKSENRNDNIIISDVLFNKMKPEILFSSHILNSIKTLLKQPYKTYSRNKIINSIIPNKIQEEATYVTHIYQSSLSSKELFETAKNILKQYSQAKLVITSRIHCALPCLALGTPVLFVIDGLTNEISDLSRFRGVLEHINIISTYSKNMITDILGNNMHIYNAREIDWNNPPQNPDSYISYSKKLKEQCFSFIHGIV